MRMTVIMGTPGSGKSTWAAEHTSVEAVVSADAIRHTLTGDQRDISYDDVVWSLYYNLVDKRLINGRDVVCDGGALDPVHRAKLLERARTYGAETHLICLDVPGDTCVERDAVRVQPLGERVVRDCHAQYKRQRIVASREAWDRITYVNALGGESR